MLIVALAFVFCGGQNDVYAASKSKTPAKVTAVKVEKKTRSSISLEWKKVKAVRTGIKKNKVSYQVKKVWGKDNQYHRYYTVKEPRAKMTGLKSGTRYTFKVRAYYKNSEGKKVYGKWSDTKTVYTKPAAISVVSGLKATSTKDKVIDVKWEKVSKVKVKGKFKTMKYQLAYKEKDADKWNYVKTSKLKIAVTKNLKAKTAYEIKIRAYYVNDSKNVYGKWSKVVSVTTPDPSLFSVTAKQDSVNYTGVTLTLKNSAALEKNGKADKIKVAATMSYKGTTTREVNYTFALGDTTYAMDLPEFGTWDIKAVFYKEGKQVWETKTTVNIVADEYNIASINATYPVTLFTLQLWDITEKEDGTPVPTIVNLYRAETWDWDNLPPNVYAQPNLTMEQSKTRIQYATKYRAMADYVGQLYEANPNATFHLYINDGYYKLILQILCANKIPEDQYKVTLLSDGSGSYVRYSKTFNVADPQKKYDEMAAGWDAAKKYCYENGEMDLDSLPYNGYFTYDYVITNEDENVEWWVGRFNKADNLFVTPSEEFNNKFFTCPRIRAVNMNNFLKAIQAKGSVATNQFKSLFHFSDTMFEEAENSGKKVMIFLGTRLGSDSESSENFRALTAFTKQYYGDDYVYYYKGHPATPTGANQERLDLLDELGITDIESSIAAELIFFFYPEANLSGYSSTTYQSVLPEQVGGIWLKSKDSSLQAGEENAKFFISKLGKGSELSSSNKYKSIVPADENIYYLVEYADGDTSRDIAIFDGTNMITKNYKVDGDTFTPVE